MPPFRPAALRTSLASRFSRPATSLRTAGFGQRIASRGYASGHGEHQKASSDIPWLVGAIAVTVPSTWWMLQPSADSHDAHGAAHDEHGEDEGAHDDSSTSAEKDESGGGAEGEDKSEDQEQSKDKSEDQEQGGDSGPEVKSTPENKGSPEGVNFKGPTSKSGDTREVRDSKSYGKTKYIKSEQGKPLGEKPGETEEGDESAASAKQPGGPNSMSGKQDKISNTQTKHSTDPVSEGKSTKGEGTPETAKSQGPVKPARPHTENKEKQGQDRV